jgi:hypothetical protein
VSDPLVNDADLPPVVSYEPCREVCGMRFSIWAWQECALEKGHEGDHLPKGHCIRHGDYFGVQCPHWPTCAGVAEHTRRLSIQQASDVEQKGDRG